MYQELLVLIANPSYTGDTLDSFELDWPKSAQQILANSATEETVRLGDASTAVRT